MRLPSLGIGIGANLRDSAIWENLSRRFGHIDEPERAKRRFDNKKQLEPETVEVFEQGLRTVFCEAWPSGDLKSKENDAMLQRRFMMVFLIRPCSSSCTSMPELTTLSPQLPKPDSTWMPRSRPRSLPSPKSQISGLLPWRTLRR